MSNSNNLTNMMLRPMGMLLKFQPWLPQALVKTPRRMEFFSIFYFCFTNVMESEKKGVFLSFLASCELAAGDRKRNEFFP